ncbi:MAG: hypothetical protein NTW84_06470 [Methanothrix sp.]|nr:hypothetical protein [Methanothrix sp.]
MQTSSARLQPTSRRAALNGGPPRARARMAEGETNWSGTANGRRGKKHDNN